LEEEEERKKERKNNKNQGFDKRMIFEIGVGGQKTLSYRRHTRKDETIAENGPATTAK
jgi:hypothetical protein